MSLMETASHFLLEGSHTACCYEPKLSAQFHLAGKQAAHYVHPNYLRSTLSEILRDQRNPTQKPAIRCHAFRSRKERNDSEARTSTEHDVRHSRSQLAGSAR